MDRNHQEKTRSPSQTTTEQIQQTSQQILLQQANQPTPQGSGAAGAEDPILGILAPAGLALALAAALRALRILNHCGS